MDTSNPSRPRGKSAALRTAAAKAASSQAFWVSLSVREDAPLFIKPRLDSGPTRQGRQAGRHGGNGEVAVTEAGRRVSECWRSLGEGRPSLVTDAFALGPREFQGILRIKPGPGSLTLPAALRLFKALSARALAGNTSDTPRSAAALWKRGYVERPLTTLKQVVEARAALKSREKQPPSREK